MPERNGNVQIHSPNSNAASLRSLVPAPSPMSENLSLYVGDIEEDGGHDPVGRALLAEQEENEKLREDNSKVREHNRILINRLQNAGESVSLRAGDKELLIPEISRDLLDTLVRENLMLKREMGNRAPAFNSSQVDILVKERDHLVLQLNQAQSVLGASSDDKAAEIHRLSRELEDARLETQELAAQCRQLVQQQDEHKRSDIITENVQKLSLENVNSSVPFAELLQQKNELQSELQQLRSEFQEVVGRNKQWQTYDKQREEHVLGVTAQNREYALKLSQSSPRMSNPHLKKVQELENERKYLQESNRTLDRRIQQLEQALNNSPLREDRGRIEILETQMQVFKEDFHQERRDREKAQERATELDSENSLIRQQLEQFQTSHMTFLAERRANTMQRYKAEYDRQINSNRLISHGHFRGQVVADCADEDEDEDVVDVPMLHSGGNVSLPPQQSMLECPKCQQQFPADNPMLFLDHNEQCNM